MTMASQHFTVPTSDVGDGGSLRCLQVKTDNNISCVCMYPSSPTSLPLSPSPPLLQGLKAGSQEILDARQCLQGVLRMWDKVQHNCEETPLPHLWEDLLQLLLFSHYSCYETAT